VALAALLLYTLLKPAPPPVVIAPKTLTVGPGGYASISSAMEKAKAGDAIEVASGDYHEQIKLKSGVTLRSRIPREARLLASPVGAGPVIFAQNVEHARVTGFLIAGDASTPLAVAVELDNSSVELDNTEIEGAGLGIEVRGGAPAIVGNAIHDCSGVGLVADGASAPWLSHNTFVRNKGGALSARNGARPSLTGNVFEKNDVDLPGVSFEALREHNYLIDVKSPRPAAAHTARGGRKE
jgi:hypothetical protein